MRLFIAIELPAEVREELAAVRSPIPGARWLPAEQLHLTLAFLGETDQAIADRLAPALAEIRHPAFRVRFTGTGCFPNRRHPRVLWAGLEPEPLLAALADKTRLTVVDLGIPQEDRPFSPHITLARLKQPVPREAAAFLDQYRSVRLPEVAVQEFVLFRSRLTEQGAIHTPLWHFRLTGAGIVRGRT